MHAVNNPKEKYDINELADKWRKGTITPAEKAWYEKWYGAFDDTVTHIEGGASSSPEEIRERIYAKLNKRIQQPPAAKVRQLNNYRIAAVAASLLLFLMIGGYFLIHKTPTRQITQNDITPGSNKAVLTLADGKKVLVTGASHGALAKQANMLITKTSEGQLHYRETPGSADNAQLMNTLATQMGGETSLTLADGTEVKLDAASSITYPVAFNGKERRVTVTGQVYFKVKHRAAQPFIITAGEQTIRDIGTEFNVNAYAVVKTTLLEGSISVNDKMLVPGQQAVMQDNRLIIAGGNTEEAAAWTKGYFRFNNEDIHTVMDKIRRWYDIDVQYEQGLTTEGFTGTVSRYKNISQIFYMLGYSNKVHFKIEGRRVTVLR